MCNCREFQARVTRQSVAASATKPEPQSEMFAAEAEEPERTTLGSLRAHGKNNRVAVNRASSSALRRGGECVGFERTTRHIIGHFRDIFTGQMTKPTVSKH